MQLKFENDSLLTTLGDRCYSFFLQQGMQDLSSLTRDQTHTPCSGSAES